MIQEGCKIQWTINGTDQFSEPRRVRLVSPCGEYCFVDGSDTGLPVSQVTVVYAAEVERFTFFWSGPFSQWHPSRFVVDGVVYSHAEQFMMAEKARLFGDTKTLARIMATNDPSQQKRLGKAVKPYDDGRWSAVRCDAVYKGNLHKFSQNRTFLDKLLKTEGTTIVEASPYDEIWGIGLAADDPRSQDRSTWLGQNLLGETLTRLRDDILEGLVSVEPAEVMHKTT